MEEVIARQNNEVEVFKKDAADLISEVSEVSDKILDFEKNKRNNLIFYGVPDDAKETPSTLDAKVIFFIKSFQTKLYPNRFWRS